MKTLWAYLAAVGLAILPPSPAGPVLARLENAPIVYTGPAPWATIVADVATFDSLRIVVIWTHPADGLGNEDSTFYRIRATRRIQFQTGGAVAPETWKRRRWAANTVADTFKVLRPAIGDSVMFTADSITQCRMGQCSVPGSAAWGYQRSAAPPSMTFIRVSTDSF
jgi:hypothetical protein